MSRHFDRHVLDGLGILRAVVEAGSFVGAGEALGLTQPAVSRAVAKARVRGHLRVNVDYAYHHSAQLMSAKVRAFLDFVVDMTRDANV
jgi:DNA-binding transcriptional LysR family regulator